MQRLASSDSGFWTTIDLLIERKWREWQTEGAEDVEEEVQLKKLGRRKYGRKKTSIAAEWNAFVAKDGRDEKLLQFPELCARMQRLHEDLVRLADEAMQKRISARQANEMERLKKLILNGKSPLKDCPPELKRHPVFLFWKFIDKEVDKLSRAKTDAYYRKIRKAHPKKNRSTQPSTLDSVESCLLPDENSDSQNDICDNRLIYRRDTTERYSPHIEVRAYKYEDEDIKELKELMTVEELYKMADRIIGSPRESTTTR